MEAAEAREKLLNAALPHVAFDGWSETTLKAAAADSGVAPGLAAALFPRGGVDLALAWHMQGDREMARILAEEDLTLLRFRDRVARAVLLRLQLADREAVRRGSTLFALPLYSADGTRAIWGTADAIWTALGDTSDDVNWYTKRMSLSAVYAATVLFWLGDDSTGQQATRDFLDRRIEDVMRFEKTKAALASNPLGKALMGGPLSFLGRIRPPRMPADLPGQEAKGGKGPRPF
ncbi:COQ9 family protein [Pseudogemmobacter bohemicus]|uniref:COQ9 family protein n=1 Tax=Pseudogemmobacter bohemicus TaxID=2250708 RepID=UPI000DD42F5E|nr:COQ9 family protein [Pseudogemmobacter bohemicus]